MKPAQPTDPRQHLRQQIVNAADNLKRQLPHVSLYGSDADAVISKLAASEQRLRFGLSYLIGVLQGLAASGDLTEGAVWDVVEALRRV